MKHFLFLVALLLALGALRSAPALAQPTTGGPTPETPPVTQPTGVPIDGGATLLLAGGVAYGLRRLRRRPAG